MKIRYETQWGCLSYGIYNGKRNGVFYDDRMGNNFVRGLNIISFLDIDSKNRFYIKNCVSSSGICKNDLIFIKLVITVFNTSS